MRVGDSMERVGRVARAKVGASLPQPSRSQKAKRPALHAQRALCTYGKPNGNACYAGYLRTFARKSSNIDNFIKLLLLIANELLVSEMQK